MVQINTHSDNLAYLQNMKNKAASGTSGVKSELVMKALNLGRRLASGNTDNQMFVFDKLYDIRAQVQAGINTGAYSQADLDFINQQFAIANATVCGRSFNIQA